MTQTIQSEKAPVLEHAVDRLYRHRFPQETLARRRAVWKVLCQAWFARYVPRHSRVLEIAPGYCEFINNVEAAERVAVDLNPESRSHADRGVVVYQCAAERMGEQIPAGHFNVAFMSNFLEHCHSRSQVLAVLGAVRAALKPGGRLLVLGPNFRYCYKAYFDYFDHYLPLTEKGVAEALELAGFALERVEPRTLRSRFAADFQAGPGWSSFTCGFHS